MPESVKKKVPNWESETIDIVLILLIVIAISSTLVPLIAKLIMGASFGEALESFYQYYRFIATFVSILLFTGIVYCIVRIDQIRRAERLVYDVVSDAGLVETPEAEIKRHRNQKWQRVEQLIESDNQSDWRLAIIEADILLDEMLSRMPYPGETVSDKLKNVEKSDFNTIESAWEAHKARNQVVHAGSDFQLTEREAKRIVGLYREVFEEFYFI